ncbi:MAG: hypothetical protein IK070_02475 [Clostridia bacterium]|nr:hypothetical protein [Clostridia bacterium]
MLLRSVADSQEKEVEYYVGLGMDRESAETLVFGSPLTEDERKKIKKESKKDDK